jgi:hypothetical protein
LRQGVGSNSSTDGSGSSSSSDCRPGDMRIFLHRMELQVRALGRDAPNSAKAASHVEWHAVRYCAIIGGPGRAAAY